MPTAFSLTWDDFGDRLYETGTDRGVLYPYKDTLTSGTNPYDDGVAWNGLTAVNESPSGAEPTPLWADNIKYLNLMSAETFACTIEAYTYPEAFEACDGSRQLSEGITIAQQPRKMFGFSYRTLLGNDQLMNDYGYKIHLVYGCTASPSAKNYQTVNDSPEAITFSWEVSTTPVDVAGFKPTSLITIDSSKVPAAKLTTLENTLYGSGNSTAARLPLPSEILDLLK